MSIDLIFLYETWFVGKEVFDSIEVAEYREMVRKQVINRRMISDNLITTTSDDKI